jgi:hypothetical protein
MSEKLEIFPLKATLGLTQAHTNTETKPILIFTDPSFA